MIPTLAWRNIWRNPTRSLVVIAAIAIGIWAALFMSGFATGMTKSYVNGAIANIVSHIQIHDPRWDQDKQLKYVIPDATAVTGQVRAHAGVKAVSARTVADGMISSPRNARGIRIKGVEGADEAAVSRLDRNVVEGNYLGGGRRNELLLSRKLADKLDVKLGAKVVLTFQDLRGDITAGAFRIVGFFDTGNKGFDEAHVFVNRADIDRLLGAPAETAETPEEAAPQLMADAAAGSPLVHEIAVILQDQRRVNEVNDDLSRRFDGLLVQTYRQISPDLELYESQIKTISMIYLTVIMLALIFGIINTMLMAVLERTRELGMLMAIGMNKTRVFFMIVLETILLGVVGGPAGLLLGHLTILYLGKYGIDLSAFTATLEMYGLSKVVYFELDPVVYWQVPVAMAITAVLASIYPALKAIRLRPVEAIRTIG